MPVSYPRRSAVRHSILPMATALVLTVVCLYFAQEVLIPIAFAILLTFLLNPLVAILERRIQRIPAVMLVVVTAALLLSGVGWLVWRQAVSLANDLPSYQANIRSKLADLRAMTSGTPFARAAKSLEKASSDLPQLPAESPSGNSSVSPFESSADLSAQDSDEKSVTPVRIVPSESVQLSDLQNVLAMLAPLLGPLPSIALVIVLVSFMLVRREDLRNRLLNVIGQGNITVASKAIDEAAQRISRYLLMQLLINGCFGIGICIGLYLIGVPYAVFWGCLAGLLRYLPYVGPWLGAFLAVAVSLIIFETWARPLLVISLFGVLELVTNLVLEPRLYGRSVGIAEVPFIVCMAFWTWIWGPVGLVLATPLTVCLAVLGKNVPELAFIDKLLGDGQSLTPQLTFYQRLISRDTAEASEIIQQYVADSSIEQACEHLMVPALTFAKQDQHNGLLSREDATYVVASTHELLEKIVTAELETPEFEVAGHQRFRILGVPAHDEADHVALLVFRHVLDPRVCELDVVGVHWLAGELVTLVEESRPAVVCIVAISPGSLAKARLFCKRLRARFEDLKIVVGVWGDSDEQERTARQLLAAGADLVGGELIETRNQLIQLVNRMSVPTVTGTLPN